MPGNKPRRQAIAGNADEWPEVIASGAFDHCLPQEVAVTNSAGQRIGTATIASEPVDGGRYARVVVTLPEGVFVFGNGQMWLD